MDRNRKTKEIFICVTVIAGVILATSGATKADFVFGSPENLGPVINSSLHDAGAAISPDGLTLAFMRHVTWNVNPEFFMSTRATKDAPWEVPENYGVWNESLWDLVGVWPGLTTADGLELYFNKGLSGGYGSSDLWVKKRDTIETNWGPPENLGPVVNSPYDEIWPVLSPDELELYFSGFSSTNVRPGGQGGADLWVTRRASRNDPWGEPVNLGPTINSPDQDSRPSMSADGLLLFFDSQRSGGSGSADLYMARRATVADPWEAPVNLGPSINSPAFEECAQLSADGSTLYWDCARAGGYGGHDIWKAPVEPMVDFNGDGIVDATDMCILVDHWGQAHSLCDIGPTPLGDGIVDVQDLTIVAEQLFEDMPLPLELAAYWRFDEGEGDIAYDSVANKAGVLHGGPVGRPGEGRKDGALEFDGIDDYVGTPFVWCPANGPFSVFAWIKGGIPGQIIVSQAERTINRLIIPGSTWLSTDPLDGTLKTELKGLDESRGILESEAVITDDQWHHVGLVWDGSYRSLYVDGLQVAKDTETMDSLIPSDGGLHIGAGVTLDVASFFRGLIDDVRIYDVALRAEKIEALAR